MGSEGVDALGDRRRGRSPPRSPAPGKATAESRPEPPGDPRRSGRSPGPRDDPAGPRLGVPSTPASGSGARRAPPSLHSGPRSSRGLHTGHPAGLAHAVTPCGPRLSEELVCRWTGVWALGQTGCRRSGRGSTEWGPPRGQGSGLGDTGFFFWLFFNFHAELRHHCLLEDPCP